jgi:redox-sensitive bicupin YhaK (pirin superfamily)
VSATGVTREDWRMLVDVRRAADRFHTQLDWLDSWHSFSFGQHRDPANTGHGLLIVNNDDIVRADGGFGTHPHRDMEIVTWVLDGELEHRDSIGTVGVIYPGLAQRMSAGSGITHSEMNASRAADVHLVQMWVLPDTAGIDPSYEQLDVNDALARGGLVPVASGEGHDGAITIHQRDAALFAARLAAGERITLPESPHLHVFVAIGSAELSGTGVQDANPLLAGDAVRVTDADGLALVAADGGTEILVWTTA